MKILITGGAGFIGCHFARYALGRFPDAEVVLVDDLNAYYDVELKRERLSRIQASPDSGRTEFIHADVADNTAMSMLFGEHRFTHVVHLAAQAGVRYAREAPEQYLASNVHGFYKTIEAAAESGVDRFLYASSSSVYGATTEFPFHETAAIASPMSLYAATKIADEAIASAFGFTHGLTTVGMRFFNVYGPWGRPDMAYFAWAEALIAGKPIELRNRGEMYRDMTYIGDVTEVIAALMTEPLPASKRQIFNIGNRNPIRISDLLKALERELGTSASEIIHTQPGAEEPLKTWADTSLLRHTIGFEPQTPIDIGIRQFADWFKQYRRVGQA